MGSFESPTDIGFIGLGAMGLGMASDLQRRPQYTVTGFDIWQPSLDKFVATGGRAGQSPRDVAQTSQFLICMAATAQQLDSILFDNSAINELPRDATIVLCSTVPPTYYNTLPARIASIGRPDVAVVDAPVSGGTLRAANGTLTIFAAGSSAALARVKALLHDMSERLYIISGDLGAASKVKMINQLLVGTHIAAASEAIALATKAGLDTREVFDIIQCTSGSSWAWTNRVPHMLEEDWTPLSALNIFVKDMFPLPIAALTEQLYISASAQGFGREDDAGLVRLFLQGPEESTIRKSNVKLIDQLLASIHLVAAGEAMAFATHLGLKASQLFELLCNAAAWSWMFESRVPKLLKGSPSSTWAPSHFQFMCEVKPSCPHMLSVTVVQLSPSEM
ncbi:NAD binding domain of 6-phosphogluconate dehydrogenase-domain-containing protein [Aspergillus insuetus]